MALTLPHALNFVRHDLIENVLRSALATASANAFVRQNLSTYILLRQEQTVTNVAHQNTFLPHQETFNIDAEALPLKEDSLMPVTQLDTAIPLAVVSKTIGKPSRKNSNAKSKGRLPTEKVEVPAYKSLTRQLPQERPREGEPVVDSDYITRLRHHKQTEREREAHPLTETRKQKPRPAKGQKIVFDYEGNLGSGKDAKSGQFEQEVLSSSVEMARQAKRGDQSDGETPQTTILTKLEDKSVRNRVDLRKDFEQPTQQKRELMLNSLKISNSKTKLVFDGHTVTRQEEIENGKDEITVLASMRKRSSVKAGNVPANEQETRIEKADLFMDVSMKGRQGPEDGPQRSRMKTVASEGKKQRISIQSQSLKKVLLTEVEDRHFELPKRRPHRIATNVTTTATVDDPDLARIREKLNIRTINQKLPKILSRYSNLQRDILKEIRKKSKV